ncbi:hypothetical protein [Mucilaginibacter limnophilus]|nr:hypothetical protein [Mucilaginibacter limnophilus]
MKRTVGYFYEYTSSSTAEADITNINNYVRSAASCPSGSDVCGVLLGTNRATGQHPVTSEFDAEKAALWDSQDSGSPANGNIQMKN